MTSTDKAIPMHGPEIVVTSETAELIASTGEKDTFDPATGLWVHMARFARFWRLTGIFPLRDLNDDCRRGLRYQRGTWIFAYSVILAAVGSVVKGVSHYTSVQRHEDIGSPLWEIYFQGVRLSFVLLVIFVQDVVLLHQLRRLPELLRRWYELDLPLRSFAAEADQTRSAFNVMFALLTTLRCATESLLCFEHSIDQCGSIGDWSAWSWLLFAGQEVIALLHSTHVYVPVLWVYMMSHGLELSFRQVRRNLSLALNRHLHDGNKDLNANLMEKSRLEYGTVCLLVRQVDKFISPCVFTCFLILFSSACTNMYSLVTRVTYTNYLLPASSQFMLSLTGFIGLAIMAFSAAKIKDEAINTSEQLRQTRISYLTNAEQFQLQYWVSTVLSPTPTLTAWGFFPLSREVITTLVGVTATYVTVLLQFRI